LGFVFSHRGTSGTIILKLKGVRFLAQRMQCEWVSSSSSSDSGDSEAVPEENGQQEPVGPRAADKDASPFAAFQKLPAGHSQNELVKIYQH
jgi:hypothetical protein